MDFKNFIHKKSIFRCMAVMILSALILTSVTTVSAEDDYDKSQTVYVMGSAHTDTLWDWLPSETVKYLYQTWASTMQLLENNEDYKFNASTAKHYKMLWEYYPEIKDQILDYYAEGRIGNAGFYVQCDVNMPSAESLIRQGLYAQEFYQENFGEKTLTMITPDNFGIGWMLPQIALGTGYDRIVGWRAGINESNFFNWIGPDGSSIPFYHSSVHYFGNTPSADVKLAMDGVSDLGLQKALYFSGYGDKGGGPTQDMIDWLADLNKRENYPEIIWALYEDYFNDLTDEDRTKIVLDYASGIYLNACQGTFTTQAAIKDYNRKSEVSVNETEAMAVLADWLGVSPYPESELKVVWDKLMTNQFHDAITGTSIYEANQQIWNDYEILLNLLDGMKKTAGSAINSKIDTRGEGIPLIVYNSLSQPHTDIVEITVTLDSPSKGLKLYDPKGKEIPVQIIETEGNQITFLFVAEKVPSMGYRVYHAIPDEMIDYTTDLHLDGYQMENEFFIVEISKETGNIKRIYDKNLGREILAEGEEVELVLLTDTCNAWDVNNAEMAAEPAVRLGHDMDSSIEIIETGPVRSVIRVSRTCHSPRSQKDSTYIQDIILYSGIDRVEVKNTIDWNERYMILKASVPCASTNEKASYDLSDGVCTRTVNNQVHAEVFGVKWADISEKYGEFGVSLLNNSRYGYDMPNDHTMRLSLLRSARDQDKTADKGVHNVSFAIYSHSGTWSEGGTQLAAYEFNYPLTAIREESHEGILPAQQSFITVDNDDVLITAVKLAEETLDSYEAEADEYNSKIALRVTELNGKNGITATNMLEEPIENISSEEGSISIELNKFGIKTIVAELSSPFYQKERAEVTPVNLNQAFNTRGISLNHEVNADTIQGKYSLPAEQTPESFMTDGITFRMGEKEEGVFNSITAKGQSIALPSGQFDAIYLLACAVGTETSIEDTVIIHYTDGSSEKATFRFEDWNRYRDWEETEQGNPIGLTYNHYHDSGEDAVESRVNLSTFAVRLDESKTLHSLTLPDNNLISVFAVSLAKGSTETDYRFSSPGVIPYRASESFPYIWVAIPAVIILLTVVVFCAVRFSSRKKGGKDIQKEEA